jgi:hypothetical protein
MEIFSMLEEQNLFLIQNSQETELALEELRQKKKQTELSMNTRTASLEAQIRELDSQIAGQRDFANSLQARRQADAAAEASKGGPTRAEEQDKDRILDELKRKVREVYVRCIDESSSELDTLPMLSKLESHLEHYLAQIERLDKDFVISQEKRQEKRRRELKRKEQQDLQAQQQLERNSRAQERSKRAPKKRTGKPVMWRSVLIKKETSASNLDEDNKDNDDEVKFLN